MSASQSPVVDSQSFLPSLQSSPLHGLLFFALIIFSSYVASSIATAFRPDLRSIPGPFLAQFTSLYRPWHISKGDNTNFYRNLHKKYGQIVRTGPKTLSISDPKALPIIYGVNSKFTKSGFYEPLSPILEGAVTPSMFSARDPAVHQALRRPVAQKYSATSMKSLEPFADECGDIFIQAMKDMEGQVVDLSTWLQWYAFDVIGSITFQRRFGFMEERKDILGMIAGIDMGLRYGGIVGQVPSLHAWLLGNPWLGKLLAALNVPDAFRSIIDFIQECIDDYDKEPAEKHSDRPDFLAWFRSEELKGRPMSHRDLINNLSNNLLAGSDTTAMALRAIVYYLVQNPQSYKRLQREIDEADRAGNLSKYVTYAECLELKYLQAVMKEAMRCHPGVTLPLERVVPEGGAALCGVHLDEGTVVGINPVVLHQDKAIFGGDADVFRPERWIESDDESVKNMDRHFMTFGYGSRTCIGKYISIMEMGKLIPQIFRNFELEWASDEPEWYVDALWFAKQYGLKCRLKSRAR